MAVDILTKSLSQDKDLYCMTKLGMCSIPTPLTSPPIHTLLVSRAVHFSGSFLHLEPSLSGSSYLNHVNNLSKTSQRTSNLSTFFQHYQANAITTNYSNIRSSKLERTQYFTMLTALPDFTKIVSHFVVHQGGRSAATHNNTSKDEQHPPLQQTLTNK